MKPLTAALLQGLPFTALAGPAVVARGRAYYTSHRVVEVELRRADLAVCLVAGDSGDHEVRIRADSSRIGVGFSCDCAYAEENQFCKHMVAAALELSDYLEDKDEDDDLALELYDRLPSPPRAESNNRWQNKLGQALTTGAPRAKAPGAPRSVALVVLERASYYDYGYSYGSSYLLAPYTYEAAEWPALQAASTGLSAEAINALLDKDRRWTRTAQPLRQVAEPTRFLNLDAQSAAFLNALVNVKRLNYNYGGGDNSLSLLPLLSKFELPFFLGEAQSGRITQRLRIVPEPVDITLDLETTDGAVHVVPGYERDGQFERIGAAPTVLSERPTWALLGNLVAQLRSPHMVSLLSSFPIKIPAGGVETFREQYLVRLAETLPIRAGVVQWQEVRTDPVPRLYLRDDRASGLSAELRFGYGPHELAPAKKAPATSVAAIPNSWQLVRIFRAAEREAGLLASLAGTNYGLKHGDTRRPYGTYLLRAHMHPFDFLLNSVPKLAQSGFEIFGEEALKVGKINRSTPRLRVSLTSGIDWFDLKAAVEFGDQQISLQAIRKALQRGERFVKLADGSAGLIPDEWLEKYRHLWKLATETEDSFRVSDMHLALIDPLLDADPAIEVPADWLERRNRLRSFERIAVRPVAEGFCGELRPYQKHGVDWLHFLADFHFGGILADDMGLGKTVQVLALLQARKEQAQPGRKPATLLVVPKSLVANWQREAARFTPGLSILCYLGNFRSKDTARFGSYDLVLTTYGTALRDVEQLRKYRFHYLILDESQAIKNPLAKSTKAVRLLQAEQRLVLTGTPVENNTLELWSQFAFVNPGLLGGLDFFRQEFANPIESRGDEAAAANLRKLVYPFILRRTKEQVAPELPPRTERVLYCDMDGAQKKLYGQTRERYRAELLGLIEQQGLNDARFKILEGLLRLRQIAIHPALVDARYAGKAPKLELLLETLETLQAEHHKALIFSQFVGMLKLVRHELEARQLRYMYLDGRTGDRQARVDQFQNDPGYPFFLISLKAGGVGLNLTAADYVIHLDPWWNPAVEMQASDRAHRIGQDKPVFIYKLIARDTVEEKILQLQEKKRALVKSLITTEAGFFKSLTRDDVSLLFG